MTDATPSAPPPSRVIRKALVQILWCVVTAALLAFALAVALPQDLRRTGAVYERLVTLVFVVRSAQLHLSLGTFALALAALMLRRWRLALVSLLLAIACVAGNVRDLFPKSPPSIVGKSIRVMQMNLWMANRNGDAIVSQIAAADPDIIVQQETTPWSIDLMTRRLGKAYPHFYFTPGMGSAVVFSKTPLQVGGGVLPGRQRLPLILHLDGADVALYGVHLVSPAGRWTIVRNRQQTAELCEILAAEKRPVILVGDFNFTPTSANFSALERAGVRSSHQLAGRGFGLTWHPGGMLPSLMPGVRIDHILLTSQLTASRSIVGGDTGSDHRPVIADIGLRSR